MAKLSALTYKEDDFSLNSLIFMSSKFHVLSQSQSRFPNKAVCGGWLKKWRGLSVWWQKQTDEPNLMLPRQEKMLLFISRYRLLQLILGLCWAQKRTINVYVSSYGTRLIKNE